MNASVKNKILLIEPPFYRSFHDKYSLDKYPLPLGYLASTIKKRYGLGCVGIQCRFKPKSILMKHPCLKETQRIMKISHLTGAGFEKA